MTVLTDALVELIRAQLPRYLPHQRWSGAADRTVTAVELQWHEVLRTEEPYLVWTVARATFDDGDQQDYQLFVGAREATRQPDFLHGKDREILTVAAKVDDDGDLVLYDALVDPDLAIEVLHLVDPDIVVEHRRPIVLEHSNSSVVFDEAIILKVFRKVEAGPNPDVEMTRRLAEHGFDHVLPTLGVLERDHTHLAVLRPFLVGSVEGWTLARTSVRDVLASRQAPEDAGADFAPDAARLGCILAEMHLALARSWPVQSGDAAVWAAEHQEHLAAVGEVPGLDTTAVARRFDELAALSDAGREIHIHGDLHLAQVIQTDLGWVVLDFEGEPARRRSDRFTRSSPLRDVAGMLRSFHYAAAAGRSDWSDHDDELDLLVLGWEQRNRDAFLDAYFGTEGVAALLPATAEAREAVLASFELDKAVYEVGYELGHRPDQVGIPLAGIERLLPRPAR